MTKFYKSNECPENTLISKDLKSFDYCDSYVILKRTNDSVDDIAARIFIMPKWVLFLLKLRHYLIAKPFGLSTGTHEIPVLFRSENEIVMGEDDKHLYFRLSILKKETCRKTGICLTTIVKYNNVWGKIYFFVIKPFHKLVVKSLLKKL